MSSAAPLDPRGRDRAVQRVRSAARLIAFGAAGATAGLSVVAAHAFKGHDGRKAAVAARPSRAARTTTTRVVHVPPPQHVPAIAGAPAPLAAPATPPASAPPPAASSPAPAPPPPPPPETSGGS